MVLLLQQLTVGQLAGIRYLTQFTPKAGAAESLDQVAPAVLEAQAELEQLITVKTDRMVLLPVSMLMGAIPAAQEAAQ